MEEGDEKRLKYDPVADSTESPGQLNAAMASATYICYTCSPTVKLSIDCEPNPSMIA